MLKTAVNKRDKTAVTSRLVGSHFLSCHVKVSVYFTVHVQLRAQRVQIFTPTTRNTLASKQE